jgi:asparagine synthase (glutamine-hydrolysing)
MCGIAGFIDPSVSSHEDAERLVLRMTSKLRHRGPDDSGRWIDVESGVVLGHTRLAILDLSETGKQPMHSHSGRFCITFNGEIYNHSVLRKTLIGSGLQFRGTSDTEVILAALDAWGIHETLERMSGMFAIAIWDKHRNALTLCRDRLGEKPLYYAVIGGRVAFASELKALMQVPFIDRALDYDALATYLKYGYVPDTTCIMQGVRKLPAGAFLTIPRESLSSGYIQPLAGNANNRPAPYWSIGDSGASGQAKVYENDKDAIDELDSILHTVVEQQSIADVPIGAFLSGGIDSTLVTAVMQAESDRPVRTFTIGFDDPRFDEAPLASKIAEYLGTEHVEEYVSAEEALALVPDLQTIFDEPFADSSQIPSLFVARVARRHVTVCLSGDGGDEIFGGYNRYSSTERYWNKVRWMPGHIRKAIGTLAYQLPFSWAEAILPKINSGSPIQSIAKKAQKLADVIAGDNLERIYEGLISYQRRPEQLLREAFTLDEGVWDSVWRNSESAFLEKAMLFDVLQYLPGDQLARVDRTSMSVSLETRLPLLSREVAQFSRRIPLDMKVRNHQGKWILRQLLNRYVPKKLTDRPKMGFSVPIRDWIRGPLKSWAESQLSRERIESDGIFDAAAVQKLLEDHLSRRSDNCNVLWALIMFQSWLDEYEFAIP